MAFRKKSSLIPLPETREYTNTGEISYWSARVQELIAIHPYFKSDGASVPRILWPVVGTPFDPRWIYEAILHDFLCRTGIYPRLVADEIFFDSLSENPSVSKRQALTFYNGTRVGSIYMEDRYYTGNRIETVSLDTDIIKDEK